VGFGGAVASRLPSLALPHDTYNTLPPCSSADAARVYVCHRMLANFTVQQMLRNMTVMVVHYDHLAVSSRAVRNRRTVVHWGKTAKPGVSSVNSKLQTPDSTIQNYLQNEPGASKGQYLAHESLDRPYLSFSVRPL
jgi:hypothetical protein